MSAVAELLESWIDVVTANGVHWGYCSALVAVVSHFLELNADLEVIGSRCSAGLIEDEVDALWSWVHVASESLSLHVPSSVARNLPDSAGE
jgi:hypothetical protein